MITIISILRGINVGKRRVLMTDLKALYEKLEFKEVSTFIQSGNVIFKTDKKLSGQQLAERIEQALIKQYGFNVPVINRTLGELKKLVVSNPFLKIKGTDQSKLHVTFLAREPETANRELVEAFDYSPDQFIISGSEVFLYIPGSYAETKLSNNFFESKLKVSTTTRNWNTVTKLAELAEPK
ncbi:MAG: DUF1697 domain-containing protein [Chitinophagales bacterium]